MFDKFRVYTHEHCRPFALPTARATKDPAAASRALSRCCGVLLCIALSSLTGCPFIPWDRMWWPVVRNDFGEPIDIHIAYSNGTSRDWHTQKGQCVVTGIPQVRSTELIVTVRGTQQLDLDRATLDETLEKSGQPEIAWSLRPGAVTPIGAQEIGNLGHCQH
jgi:hypothetical protein